VRLELHQAFSVPTTREELICYFNVVGSPKLIKIKTFRCDYDSVNFYLDAYVPEELRLLTAGQDYELKFTAARVIDGLGDGLEAKNPSAKYWIVFRTFNALTPTYEVGWLEASVPPCPFDENTFYVESVSWQASPELGNTWTIINMTL
jgi:hypothetical protein